MAQVDISGADPWPSIGGDGGMFGDGGGVLGSAGSIGLGVLTGGASTWLQLGAQILGGALSSRDTSSAQAGSSGGPASLNTSGWVVGEGDATGGDLSASQVPALPWYVWAVAGVGVLLIMRKKKAR